jgi:hypothetical protein
MFICAFKSLWFFVYRSSGAKDLITIINPNKKNYDKLKSIYKVRKKESSPITEFRKFKSHKFTIKNRLQ